MTTTSADPTTAGTGPDRVHAAAAAAAAVLPASEPLSALEPQPATDAVTGLFAGAAVADLVGVPARIAILVGQDLVDALASSPLGGLDLAAAVQPALDAAAAGLGTSAQAGRTVPLELVLDDLGGPLLAVPLAGSTIVGALLVPESLPTATAEAETPSAAFTAPLPETVAPVAAPAVPAVPATGRDGLGIEMLHGVEMEVTVELGRTRMPVRELLALAPGTVLELDRAAGSAADLLVNGRLIARGEVVIVDEDFGLRVTEILDESVG